MAHGLFYFIGMRGAPYEIGSGIQVQPSSEIYILPWSSRHQDHAKNSCFLGVNHSAVFAFMDYFLRLP
jgi:hypothetical protein